MQGKPVDKDLSLPPSLFGSEFDALQGNRVPTKETLHTIAERTARAEEARRRRREKAIERPAGTEFDDGIKSRERVQDLGEVLTPEREVNAMLDLVDNLCRDIRSRFLEPSCGNGNFLEEIIARKVTTISSVAGSPEEYQYLLVLALTSIYGIDIDSENILEARERMYDLVVTNYLHHTKMSQATEQFLKVIDYVLNTNLIVGNAISGAYSIQITEFTTPEPEYFVRRIFSFGDLANRDEESMFLPSPSQVIRKTHYLELSHVD